MGKRTPTLPKDKPKEADKAKADASSPSATKPVAKGPPRARIVTSGNSGNSAASKVIKPVVDDGRPPPLFPVGYKTPLSLLNERCQKNGWQKPDVQPFKLGPGLGHCAVVRITRIDPRNGAETITLRPSTEEGSSTRLEMPTALEAKHWASVYALHRFASALQLGMVLPPPCRDYWAALQAEKKAANAKDAAFLYADDPFAAQAAKDAARQAAQDRREAQQAAEVNGNAAGRDDDKGSKKWPEVRIGRDMRSEMQNLIRAMRKLRPPQPSDGGANSPPFVPTETMRDALLKNLLALGYRRGHVTGALDYISITSPSADPLLEPLVDHTAHSSDPLNALKETVLQYLQITLSEEELPVAGHGFRGQPESVMRIARRGNATPGSDSAKSGASTPAGEQAPQLSLADTWLVERISREAGYPIDTLENIVRRCGNDEALVIDVAANKLVGKPIEATLVAHSILVNKVRPAIEQRRDIEIDALQSMLGPLCHVENARKGNRIVTIRIHDVEGNSTSLSLRFLLSESSAYPSTTDDDEPPVIPSFYVLSTGPEPPAYIRLHLTASIVNRVHDPELTDWMAILRSGEGGVIYEMAAYLSEIIADVLANPPAAADVMQHLRSTVTVEYSAGEKLSRNLTSAYAKRKQQGPANLLRGDPKVLKLAYDKLQTSAEYSAMLVKRKSLPAWSSKAEVVDTIANNRIVIISGATGSGKTTQCPAFVLEAAMTSGQGAASNIICTQPRRISAIGVAQRVAQEHGQKVGEGLFGYAIRGERKASRDCRLLFCTTGILLQRLSRGGDPDLSDVSHVFVDEVHERSLDSDFLMLILKEVLQRNQRIKVILMSATADSARFSRYFGHAPCIEIPGQAHAVEDFYLEDIMRATRYQAAPIKASRTYTETENADIRNSFLRQGIEDVQLLSTLTMLTRGERIDYDLVAATAKYLCSVSTVDEAILIFVTGVAEITQTMRALQQALSGEATEIMPLHANLSPNEQSRIFRKTTKRKIIVATNVAETSITVDDVVYVIDTGRVKETRFDAENGLQRLVEDWNSLAGARQRRGRAGRTKPGQCWKLYTRWQEERIPTYAQPEILRTPLAALVLQVKALRGESDVAAFLAGALDAPDASAVGEALSTLARLGALCDGDPRTAPLTPLGRNLALLPLDLRLGKMLIFGSIFDCLDPILTICAALSTKSIFVVPPEQRDESKAARLRFNTGNSDLLTDLTALHAAFEMRDEPNKMRRFCEDNYISYGAVREITSLRTDYISALRSAGYSVESQPTPNVASSRAASDNLLKAIIYAGTGKAVRTKLPDAKYESTISGTSQIDHEAKQVRFFDDDGRVFIHPASILFGEPKLKNGYITYFNKSVTSKPFLRDATELQLSALLVFGRALRADAVKGGLSLDDGKKHLRAPPQLSVLVNELRRLLDVELAELIDEPDLSRRAASPVMQTIRNLLMADA